MENIIIAVDGPAGAGKSTIAKIIAKRLNINYIDTGAMYRAVTLKCLQNNVDVKDENAVIEMAKKTSIDFRDNNIYLDSKIVNDEIRTLEVSKNVSDVAKIKEVRYLMVDLQREIGKNNAVILDGRDIGSYVFPNADYKFFLVATPEERGKRRNIELKESYSPLKVVVPGKTLQEISKILTGEAEDMVDIFFADNHILFEFDETKVVSRLIEGEYFHIDQMLSSDYDTKVKINKREFLSCIDRATLLIREGDKKPIILNIQDGSLQLKINSFVGSMNEEIEIEKEGKDLLIGFNPKFFIDALRVIDDEEVTLYMVNPKAPCFIKDDAGTYVYLILPVNFNAATV